MLAHMRHATRWSGAVLPFLCLGLACVHPPPAQEVDETQRWVPAFSAYSGVLVQNAKGDVVSGPITGNRIAAAMQPIRPPASGSDLQVTPFVAGSVEIMTPALLEGAGRPRLFVHGDAAASFGFSRDIVKEGLPDQMVPPKGFTGLMSEQTVLGQGSDTAAEVKTLQLSAGAGLAFTFDVGERRFRIKPSVEWLREAIELSGVVNRAVRNPSAPCTVNPQAPGCAPLGTNYPEGFRLITLSGSDEETYHAVGSGLELEADTLRAGPFMLTVFLAGQAYRFLGDLEVEFSDSQIPPCNPVQNCTPPPQPETATWTFEKDRWAYRGGVGLRFRWLPD
jgi:hypothetical protein